MIALPFLNAPKTSTITVTRLAGKPDKLGLYEVLGFRTGDAKLRLVRFWVYRKEAEEIARMCATGPATEDAVCEIDEKAWVFVHAPAGVAA